MDLPTRLATALAVTAALVLAGCTGHGSGSADRPSTESSSAGSSGGSITVGSGNTAESVLLATIYADALSAKGISVTTKLSLGVRPAYLKALSTGEVGMVPDYSGALLDYLATTATATAPAAVYDALRTAAAASGLVPLSYAPAQDGDTITVTKATADRYHLASIADLAPVASGLTLAATADFRYRADGIAGLKAQYGVTFGGFTPQAAGTATDVALEGGSVDAADLPSTDAAIASAGLVTLADPKNLFTAQNVVPVFAKADLTPAMTTTCDAVSAKLDTATLAALDAQVAGGQAPDAVAKAWLTSQGLG